MAVQQRQYVDAVRCRTFLSGSISMFVFDILQIPTGYTALATGLSSTHTRPRR